MPTPMSSAVDRVMDLLDDMDRILGEVRATARSIIDDTNQRNDQEGRHGE